MIDLQAKLTNAYGDLPMDELRREMAQGFQVAMLAGMAWDDIERAAHDQAFMVASSHGYDGGSQRPPTADDYANVLNVLTEADYIALSGEASRHGQPMIVVRKQIGNEVYRCVFEVRHGKRNRALALWSMAIKLLVSDVKAGGG